MAQWTAKSWPITKAPAHVALKGEKTTAMESALHIIEFPGGAIEVARTNEGNYWAHIIVHHSQVLDDVDGLQAAYGAVIDSRIDTPNGVIDVPQAEVLTQIAVLIRPVHGAPDVLDDPVPILIPWTEPPRRETP
jgi:hypothetical protein